MWVKRSDEEVAQWEKITQRDARSHAMTMASVVGLALIVLGIGGWVFNLRAGIVAQRQHVSGVATRTVFVAGFSLLFAGWLYRRELQKELGKSRRRTICRSCGQGGEAAIGSMCSCGGVIVPQSTMKWVEDATG